MKKTTKLKNILNNKELNFLMEAHNALSAKIVSESGFEGVWASGLCMSASMALRDNNEASWTQILEVVELMSDATDIPILLDGDTGYGNFNNMRRLVKKLEQRGVAGVCIEDKLFPKTNSFIKGDCQPLADIEEFSGKIKAGKDTQQDSDFCIVARIEALIAGWGLREAIKRAMAYKEAGADAILIHSDKTQPNDILEFIKAWDNQLPVVVVPTKYYRTPTEVFRHAKVSLIIWANHMLRSAIVSMQNTARFVYKEKSVLNLEENIAPLIEVFRLQCSEELQEAEERYFSYNKNKNSVIILAASHGKELGQLTHEQPKTLININGKPLLNRIISTFYEFGIKDLTVVRGYKKEKISIHNIKYIDNDDYENTREVFSLFKGLTNIVGDAIISYGDILFKKYVINILFELDGDFNIVVDSSWQESLNKQRYINFVSCNVKYRKEEFEQKVFLQHIGNTITESDISGEWIGILKLSSVGTNIVKSILNELSQRDGFKSMRISELFNELISRNYKIHVAYTHGAWIDIDDIDDFSKISSF